MIQFLKITSAFVFTFLGFFTRAQAQPKVTVEQIQAYSVISPNANYWHLPKNINPLLEALDEGLFSALKINRDKNYSPLVVNLIKANQLGKISISWTNTKDSDLHAYLELYEMDPAFVYKNKFVSLSEIKKDSINAFWFISCHIFNQKQEIIFKKTLLLAMMPVKSLGMGISMSTPTTSPVSSFQAVTKVTALLSPLSEDLEYVEAKVPSSFITDNLWMPFLQDKPRLFLDTSKQYISYVNKTGSHLLRTPAASMKKINSKDKSLSNPYYKILPLIRKRQNYYTNEFYEVIQPIRNVNNNTDYSLKAIVEFDLQFNQASNTQSPIVFLPDSIHIIYQDKDSIGYFEVQENVVEKNKFANPNILFNGLDSTKQFDVGTFFKKETITSSKLIMGKIKAHPFKIIIHYESDLKTIFLDDQMILIAEGKNKPYKMVESTTAVDESIKDFLLQMSFSELFQLPTNPLN